MAKQKKKTPAQVVVGAAATGMPAPVKSFATGKWTARLVLLVAALAVATGLIAVDWSEGWPRFSVDGDRAEELKHTAQQGIQKAKERLGHQEEARRILPLK